MSPTSSNATCRSARYVTPRGFRQRPRCARLRDLRSTAWPSARAIAATTGASSSGRPRKPFWESRGWPQCSSTMWSLWRAKKRTRQPERGTAVTVHQLKGDPMIYRKWTGRIRTADRAEYVAYIVDTGLADYANTPGNRGYQMITRD